MESIRRVAGPAQAGRVSGVRAGPAGGGFGVPVEQESPPTGPLAPATAPAAAAGLIALQEAGDERVAEREARRRGRALLAELAGLQRDLLAGGADSGRLARLETLLARLPVPADAGLREALEAVALRTRVELARYGRG